MGSKNRESGIDILGKVPWGTHMCQFYENENDLTDILVPYFKASLENNEFCMWVTDEPLNVDAAKASLSKEMPDLDDYINKGQMEIIEYSDWYTRSGEFDADTVLNGWVEKLNSALENNENGGATFTVILPLLGKGRQETLPMETEKI